MKLVTPAQMREIDRRTIEDIGIPGAVLMENAALGVVRAVEGVCAAGKGSILVLAGRGNNGGDAFAAVRHLHNRGAAVSTYLFCKRGDIGGDALTNLSILEKIGVSVIETTPDGDLPDSFMKDLGKAEIILDGIFGTGFRGRMEGAAAKAADAVNCSGKPVIAIDIPSGVSGDTGAVEGCCIKAFKTVALGLPKIGLAMHPGCDYAGEVIVADIGIPGQVIEGMGIGSHLTDIRQACMAIPARRADSSKGDYGKILLVTGSTGMTGAGGLAAEAALRTGAGLVYLGVPASLASVYDSILKEAVTIPLEDGGKGYLDGKCLPEITGRLKGMSAVAVGPGMSAGLGTLEVVTGMIENSAAPLVLDADALNAVAADTSLLKKLKTPAVLTPHPGEMGRLCGISASDVQNNRLKTALDFSDKYGVVIVLKGSCTIVAAPDGVFYVNPAGNSGMATAGSGDVLTGVIAGLLAQGAPPLEAAFAGVFAHGTAGDIAAASKGEYGLIAGDIAAALPGAMKRITAQRRIITAERMD